MKNTQLRDPRVRRNSIHLPTDGLRGEWEHRFCYENMQNKGKELEWWPIWQRVPTGIEESLAFERNRKWLSGSRVTIPLSHCFRPRLIIHLSTVTRNCVWYAGDGTLRCLVIPQKWLNVDYIQTHNPRNTGLLTMLLLLHSFIGPARASRYRGQNGKARSFPRQLTPIKKFDWQILMTVVVWI